MLIHFLEESNLRTIEAKISHLEILGQYVFKSRSIIAYLNIPENGSIFNINFISRIIMSTHTPRHRYIFYPLWPLESII